MAKRLKYLCPWCGADSCCIKNIKKHITELHGEREHWTSWLKGGE